MKVKMETFKCDICDMSFRDLGKLSGRKRLFHHRRTDHRASCCNCGKMFVSYSHVTIHQYQCHDVICIRCKEACEGRCLEEVVQEIESAGSKVMNIELEAVEIQIRKSEEVILNKFSGASEHQMNILQDMIWFLDNGFTGCSANSWGMLAYIPFVEINPGLYGLSDFGQDYVLKHTYLSALKKLDRYLSNVCRYEVPKQIDAYSKNCVKLHNKNALLDINPEKLIGSKLCFPEREVSDHSPIQWEESSPQEIIVGKGVTNEPQSKEEPEASGVVIKPT